MKQKTKHLSKATMSIVLVLVLIVSTVAVGVVATSAAYIGGGSKPSGNTAAVNGQAADDDAEDAVVGANAPEAVGAHNAGGSTNTHGIYFTSKNSSTDYDYEFYNAVDVNITITVADFKVDSNNRLYFRVKKYSDGIYYGNNNVLNSPGSSTTLAGGSQNGGYFKNANNYTTITFKLTVENDTVTMHWVSGVSTAHNITKDSEITNGSISVPSSANADSTVTITATPATGYQLSTVSVYKTGDSSTMVDTSGSGNTRTFTMPNYDVTVSATFSVASYEVTADTTHCSVNLTGSSPYAYGSTVSFTVTPQANYALQTLTVKQGTTNVQYTDNLDGTYTFTMPAGAVEINAVCANTSGTTTVYFKSATAYVYHPLISVNGGTEQAMTVDTTKYLNNGTNKSSAVKPKSDTGSLRYAWYKIELTDVDLTSPVSILIRGQDTYMEATGTFSLTENGSVYLACDNLMEGNTLVNLTSASTAVKDFYDTPLHMVATAEEIAAIDGN